MSWRRSVYTLVWYLATPLIRRYLKKRARKAPAYLQHWDERFGRQFPAKVTQPIWIHAVSVGETRAALPLVSVIRQHWPDAPILMTQMTPTGRATAQELYPDAEVCYLPYDYPQAVQTFLSTYQPRFGVLMETELWPNTIHFAREQGVPLFLANARLSQKSLNGYRRIRGLISEALLNFTGIAAQTRQDAERLQQLAACDAQVCGNTKYDFEPPADKLALGKSFRQAIPHPFVLVCASTREGEEALLIEAWKARQAELAKVLLVVVPRHPERFAGVAESVQQAGLTVQRRSEGLPVRDTTQVWLGDSMGELFAYYAAADLAFIGGSLLPLGGQNLIEPASIGVPVLFGPHMFNFADASAKALESGAACQVQSAADMVDAAIELLKDAEKRQQMSADAREFTALHRGASLRIVELIHSKL